MAVAEYLIIASDDFDFSGLPVNATMVQSYEGETQQAQLPNGEARTVITFHLMNSKLPIQWVYGPATAANLAIYTDVAGALTGEMGLIDAAISEVLTSD